MNGRLPEAQHRVLRLWVLTGDPGKHSTNTIEALISKGLLGRDGPNEEARTYIDQCEREDIASLSS